MSVTTPLALTTEAAALPKVNLLPAEIAEAAQLRRIQVLGGAVAIAAVAVAGGAFALSAQQVSAAQSDLEAAQSAGAVINQKIAEYAHVPAVLAEVAAAQGDLELAMGQEVRYSYLLNDLSLSIPNDVWLTDLSISQTISDAGMPGAAPAAGATAPEATPTAAAPAGVVGMDGTPGITTINFTGSAKDHRLVAAWLESLQTQPVYADATFTDSKEAAIDGTRIVEFTSQVVVTDQGYSGRYTKGVN